MSSPVVPLEFLALVLGSVTATLGVVFTMPQTFCLRSPGSRVAALRILVGVIWAGDATLKFVPGAPPLVAYYLVWGQAQLQPSLAGWFSFWAGTVAANPAFWWYGAGAFEGLLAACLVLGLARRVVYLGGFAFSLGLWAVPEGFGGPYDLATIELGVGLASAVVFLLLLQMDSTSGPARWTADVALERRWLKWKIVGGPAFRSPPLDERTDYRLAWGESRMGDQSAAHPDPGRNASPMSGIPCGQRGPDGYLARGRLFRQRNPRGQQRGTFDLYLAFEAFVLLFLGLIVGVSLAAALGSRIRAILSSAAVRTAALRVFFGGIWLVIGALRLQPGVDPRLSYWLVVMAGDSQPSWLASWFSFWASATAWDPMFWWYGIGLIELAVGICLVAGFLRRPAYLAGATLSLYVWAVPGGFGGPYLPGFTDMGAGILYALAFMALLHLDSISGGPRLAADAALARASPAWQTLTGIRAPIPSNAKPR